MTTRADPPPTPDTSTLAETWDRRWLGGLYEAAPPLEEVKQFVERHLQHLGPGDLVLDAGCGNGRHLRALASSVRMVGTDVSRHALRALAVALQLDGRSASAVRCRHDALPFPRGTFSAGMAVQSLQDGPLAAASQALRELHVVLRSGAPLYVRVPARRHPEWRSEPTEEPGTLRWTEGPKAGLVVHLYEPAEVSALASAAGFDIEDQPWITTAPKIPPQVGTTPFVNVVLRARGLRVVSLSRRE